MTKIIVPLANGFEEMEAIVPVDIWRRAGFEVITLSITNELIVTGTHQISVLADALFEETNFDNADMIFLPGGMPGAKNLNAHKGLRKKILEFSKADKILSAICAAPMVLGHNNLLDGKRATCFPGFEAELYNANVTNTSVETDGNIVTAKGAGVAMQFALAIVARFKGNTYANELSNQLQIND